MSLPAGLLQSLADRYRIERELGAGGMATVYLAHDLRHERDVAIKVLHSDVGAALGAERFLSEIRTTARLQHPHILPLLDSGNADGLLYYVMPVVTGETLRARLERERQLPIADAVRLACEIASALDYAHRHGVIHRDIKPENILLHDGQAEVADFGIALAVQSAGTERLTQTGLSLGTPQYMSPEQAMGERVIDARADVYALGAVTYEMLTGEAPFTGATVQAIVARLISEEPRPLAIQRKSIPEHVEVAVMRALQKLPADRFASAAEFAAALDARTAATTSSVASRTREKRGRRTTFLLGALAIAGVIAAVWGWTRPAPTPEVVRYRIVIDSVPAVKDWAGELAISADGSTIIRAGGPGGTLLVRRRDELAFSPLAGTEGAAGPFFSPDGTRIGYYTNGALMAAPLAGGPPVVIADSVLTPESVTWANDGYLYRSTLTNGTQVLARCEPRPGAPLQAITTVDTAAGELTHLQPDVLPDGKTVLFQVAFRDGRTRIGIGDIGGSHSILLDGAKARYSRSGHLLYTTADGKLWAVPFDAGKRVMSGTAVQVGDRVPATIIGPIDFAISASGTLVYSTEDAGARRELAWVRRDGTRALLDSSWKGEFSSPSLSPDGSAVAVALRDGARTDIWIKPVTGGIATRITGEQHRSNVEPAWSPDGRWVSYLASSGVANRGDVVWRQRVDGSGSVERVVQSTRPLSEQTWTRDGALLVRTTTATTGSGDVLIKRAGPGDQATPLLASSRSEYSPIASPDGKWLAYVANETGRFEVYVTQLANPGAGKWAVSTNGGSTPRWSHRGNEIFYIDVRSNLVAAHFTTTPSFAVQSRHVLFSAADFIQTSVSRRSFDVAADDQRFLMVQRADGAKRGQVVVIEHWPEDIRRRSIAK